MTRNWAVDKFMRMNGFEPPMARTSSPWVEKLQALLEVLLLSGIMSSLIAALPFYVLLGDASDLTGDAQIITSYMMLEASITVLFLIVILKLRKDDPSSCGIRFKNWRRDSFVGLSVVPILFAANLLISLLFRALLPEYFLDHNPLTDVIRTPRDLGLLVVTALIGGGIKEELQRAFILNRFQQHLGGAAAGLILWSIAFGAGHYIQGAQGMVAAGFYGLIFGIVYLARGSLVAPMVAHGTYNTLAVLGYWFFEKAAGS